MKCYDSLADRGGTPGLPLAGRTIASLATLSSRLQFENNALIHENGWEDLYLLRSIYMSVLMYNLALK